MSDRIVLANMRFMARHGVHDWEQREPQPFEVDVELHRDLRRAGIDDDLAATVDYGPVYATVQRIVDGRRSSCSRRSPRRSPTRCSPTST